jgi:hypothetical protein
MRSAKPSATFSLRCPMAKAATDDLDLVWGAPAIAKAIGATLRATYHMLEAGKLPARQIGSRWVASRSALAKHFGVERGAA